MSAATSARWLSEAIGQATRSAKFCVAGFLPALDPGIEVTGLGALQLPLKRTKAKELAAHCQVAPYGKGTETLVNKKVRSTLELDPEQFRRGATAGDRRARSTSFVSGAKMSDTASGR